MEYLVLLFTHLGMFALGVVVAKNLIHWFTVTFSANPIGAIEAEIAKLKKKVNDLRARF